jgi:hypothetical protein
VLLRCLTGSTPGDEVRLAVEQLGELRHRIVDGVTAERLSSGY